MAHYMYKSKLLISFLFLISSVVVFGQQTAAFTEADAAFKRGMDFYDKGIYNVAIQEFTASLNQLRPAVEPETRLLRGRAELYLAKSAVRANQPNAEQLMLDYIRTYYPDPLASEAALEMGDFYFNQNKVEKALSFYESVPASTVSPALRDQLAFKIGYSLFLQKKFPQAKIQFVKQKENTAAPYYMESNYYYGLCVFYENNLDEAAKSFLRIKDSKQYAGIAPYMLVQVYAAKKDYDNVLRYGLDAANGNAGKKNYKQINQLVGQAFFEKRDFANAEKYLTVGAEGNNAMREEDFYQLGFCQHKNGHYAEAAQNLENLNRSDNTTGQNGMYLLGDCYLRLGDRNKAKQAFAQAAKLSYDVPTQEEAQWNYGKLCYELKQTQEAVDALQAIPLRGKYYNEAQTLLGDALLQTRNFEGAIKVMTSAAYKSPKLRETLQKANVYQGMELYQKNDIVNAKRYFENSLLDAPDATTKTMAEYWLADITHQQKDYAASERYLNSYFSTARTLNNLPPESAVYSANYLNGYDNLKQKNYTAAQTNFQDCLTSLRANWSDIHNDGLKTQMLGDATLRLGDCFFKKNQYDNAMKYYNEAISKNYSGVPYALYQQGIIQGLQGKAVDKILSLEKVTNNYPTSEFAPIALLEVGSTYLNINQLDQAQAALMQLITNYKNRPDIMVQGLMKLGLIAQNKGNSEQAINYYKQVFYNAPSALQAKSAQDRLKDIYVNDLGKPDDYFAFLQTIPGYKADALEQDSVTYRAAEVQYEQSNYQKAIANFTTYLSRFPNSINTTSAFYYRAESHAVLKDYDNAQADYENVVQRGQSRFYEKSVENAALLAYNNKKDFAKSLDLYSKFEKVASTDDKRFEAELGAMRSAYRLNKSDAVSEFATKVASNARASQAQISTASLYLGKVAVDRNSLDEAQTQIEKSIRTNTANDEALYEAKYLDALIAYKRGQYDIAFNKADKAAENNPFEYWAGRCTILQADVYVQRNDLFGARAALNSIVDGVKSFPELITEAKQKLLALEGKEKLKSRITTDKGSNSNLLDLDKGNR